MKWRWSAVAQACVSALFCTVIACCIASLRAIPASVDTIAVGLRCSGHFLHPARHDDENGCPIEVGGRAFREDASSRQHYNADRPEEHSREGCTRERHTGTVCRHNGNQETTATGRHGEMCSRSDKARIEYLGELRSETLTRDM